MIIPMKHLTVLSRTADRKAALTQLRDLGVLHLATATPDTAHVRNALEQVQQAERATTLVTAAARAQRTSPTTTPIADPAANDPEAILALASAQEQAETELKNLEREYDRYRPFGDFDPASAAAMAAAGTPMTLFKAPVGTTIELAAGDPYRKILSETNEAYFGVQIGAGDLTDGFEPVDLPRRRLAEIGAARDDAIQRIAKIEQSLAAAAINLDALQHHRDTRADAYDFAAAYEGMSRNDDIAWLVGYVPAEKIQTVFDAAHKQGWAILARDPEPDEEVPTLLRPPRLFAPFLRVFDFLGINPAYNEADVSGMFYVFFTIFFAMLIGDAGYGLILLAGALWMRRKAATLPHGIPTLFTVFAVATIAWGLLSANYFGINPEALPGPLNHGIARWLAEQNNIMLVCFALGAVHMSLGHAWNAILLFPDSRFLAQVGWCGVVATMFCAACTVIGIFTFPKFMLSVGAVSILLVAVFMLKRNELKTKGVELGMLPLTIIGTLGDVISYVRIFAVATASLKLAATFNDMAIGLALPLIVKIPVLVLILLLGHGLNLAMGGLSILVHAIRLNTLEFSNHKGITWSGFEYKPLRRRVPAS